jgi:SagB-type dehydrogenase family enzyme
LPDGSRPAFRDAQPVAWTFHRNTSRWAFDLAEPDELRAPEPPREMPDAALVPLPAPRRAAMALDDAIAARVSCRRWRDDDLRLADLSALAGAAYGVRGRTRLGALEFLERPVPSGGGLYPLELYLLARRVEGLAPGVYHYAPLHHALERLREVALPRGLVAYLFMGQEYAADASAVLALTLVAERSLWKYGDRGYRYALLEAGHAIQNVNLVAAALGLGTCNLGGFFDDELAALLRADVEREVPLYAVAAGLPAAGDPREHAG